MVMYVMVMYVCKIINYVWRCNSVSSLGYALRIGELVEMVNNGSIVDGIRHLGIDIWA